VPRRLVISAIAALVVLAACGTSGHLRIPTAILAADPCRVVTPADARHFFSRSAVEHLDPATRACAYTVRKGTATSMLQVQAFAGTTAYGQRLYAHVHGLKGVGAKAYVHVDTLRHAAQLRFVRRGRTYALSYSVLDRRHPASASALATKLTALARKIANR